MISFFSSSKKILKTGVLQGMTDVHAHLLPGVDDGVPSEEEARVAMTYLAEIGVERMFLTPHIMADIPLNRPTALRTSFATFQQNCPSSIEFRLAGEYMLDAGFRGQMEEGLLTLGERNVLVETSYLAAPPHLQNMLYEILLNGYKPVLAHPERYLYMSAADLQMLKKQGCQFQMNVSSLASIYGKRVMHLACGLLKEGMYDFIGSDFHNRNTYTNGLSNIVLDRSQLKSVKKLLENNHSFW